MSPSSTRGRLAHLPVPGMPGPTTATKADTTDALLIAGLRAGDEGAFETLIQRHHTSMVRLARVWVWNASAAEEVAQETWLAVLEGIGAFEGRSTLRSWIFGILANKAKRRGSRETRSRPFSALHAADQDMVSNHFFPPNHPGAGHWTYPLADEQGCPERHALAQEAGAFILQTIDDLPVNLRSVILLRDVHGFTTQETCDLLGMSAANQRVTLHRARTRLRLALEPYLREDDDCVARHG